MRRALALVGTILFAASALADESSGVFVAVGYGGRRISSRDGATWENDQRWSDEAKDDDNVLFNVAFGFGRFVAVGGGAKIGHILTTTDGRAWRELPQVRGRVATIAFGNGRFIAGHDAELLISQDGEHFEKGAKLDWKGSTHARRSAFGSGEAGPRVVIIGDFDSWEEKRRVSWRASTEDGSRFTSAALDTPPAADIAYGAGRFVVVGSGGLIESSHDGQNWTRHEAQPEENFSRIAWTGERFLVTGGTSLWSSTDGTSWSASKPPVACGIAWARDGKSPLCIGLSWGGNVWLATDLASWKKVTLPAGPSLNAVAFGAR